MGDLIKEKKKKKKNLGEETRKYSKTSKAKSM